jgi:hypothetical protein
MAGEETRWYGSKSAPQRQESGCFVATVGALVASSRTDPKRKQATREVTRAVLARDPPVLYIHLSEGRTI